MNEIFNMKRIFFSKMHGLGNDFMIVNAINQKFFPKLDTIKVLANRTSGIGFDQLLILRKSHIPNFDFYCQIFNSDGTEAFQCGNGFRCLAKYIYYNIDKRLFHVIYTKRHIITTLISKRGKEIIVNMGVPRFNSKPILDSLKNRSLNKLLITNNKIDSFKLVEIGNLHIIFDMTNRREDVKKKKFINFLSKINRLFFEGINIGLMSIVDDERILLNVHERGSGETKSCGSGACAAVAFGIKDRLLKNLVSVRSKGGYLKIYWNGKNSPIFMKGSAKYVYEGSILM
ncbi:hypothetical protein AOQ87_01555 [Candidatus Riesia pediculischaeffi]|uniref:Diaminopimelate epimerase n=2 Tax=Candidatus Riesia pediculischaeffi TaxID=428411 RepID=A0A1V0HKW1_9ENTR|nr:hypothetical protein AOQ87_01555 [Candidatus Riesia pediculischaeffi]